MVYSQEGDLESHLQGQAAFTTEANKNGRSPVKRCLGRERGPWLPLLLLVVNSQECQGPSAESLYPFVFRKAGRVFSHCESICKPVPRRGIANKVAVCAP